MKLKLKKTIENLGILPTLWIKVKKKELKEKLLKLEKLISKPKTKDLPLLMLLVIKIMFLI